MPKTAWKAVLYSASLFWSHLSRIKIDISDSWREWPQIVHALSPSSGITVQQHLPGTITEFSGDLCILPEAGKSLLYVSSSVTPKKWNFRKVKKKQVKRRDGPETCETLWGKTQTLKCLRAKHLPKSANTYLSIGLPGGPSLQGRWCLSAEPWDLSDTRSQQPLEAPLHPCWDTQCTGGKHSPSSGVQVSQRWGLEWSGKTPPAVKRQWLWGWGWGIGFSRMPGSARKPLVLPHTKPVQCTFLLHLSKHYWCQGTSSDPNSHVQGEDASESWSSVRNVVKWNYHTIISILYPSTDNRKRIKINVYPQIL